MQPLTHMSLFIIASKLHYKYQASLITLCFFTYRLESLALIHTGVLIPLELVQLYRKNIFRKFPTSWGHAEVFFYIHKTVLLLEYWKIILTASKTGCLSMHKKYINLKKWKNINLYHFLKDSDLISQMSHVTMKEL